MLNKRARSCRTLRLSALMLAISLSFGTASTVFAAGSDSKAAASESADAAGSNEDPVTSTDTENASGEDDSLSADEKAWQEAAHTPASTTLTPSEGTWIRKGSRWKFQLANGGYAKSGFYKIESGWYHFNKNGYVSKGWFKVGSKKYYAYKKAAANGVYGDIAIGWNKIGKYTYYFSVAKSKRGTLFTGWKKFKGNIYYFGSNGRLRTGLQKINKKLFYFAETGGPAELGSMTTGWYTNGSTRYYFRKTGKLGVIGSAYQNTWAVISNQRYYFSSVGTVTAVTNSRSKFIRQIGELAREDMKKTGVLASVTIAQAILESNYGQSELGINARNLFGMKASLSGNNWKSAWTGATYTKKTLEYINGGYRTVNAAFRSYPDYAASIADHSAYLTGAKNGTSLRYKGLAGCKNYRQAATIIKNGGYATDPAYVTKLCAVIKAYNLTQYDK